MLKHRKKHPLTLIEIMVVIVLISIITTAVGINVHKSLELGKAFQTDSTIKRAQQILLMQKSQGKTISTTKSSPHYWMKQIKRHPLWQSGEEQICDAWGDPLQLEFDFDENGEDTFKITSSKLNKYSEKNDSFMSKRKL